MGAARWSWPRARRWSRIYAANLPLPLVLGVFVCLASPAVFPGMVLAVAELWAVGAIACGRSPRLCKVLTDGGRTVAYFQLCPLLHGLVGLLGLWAWDEGVAGLNEGGPPAALGGFAMTVMTASPFLLLAVLLGGGHRLLLDEPDDD